MKLQVGVYVGYRYRFYTEVEYDDGARVRTYDDLEMNPISIDPFISLQFKRVRRICENLIATYSFG
jgi:hypothetical protein